MFLWDHILQNDTTLKSISDIDIDCENCGKNELIYLVDSLDYYCEDCMKNWIEVKDRYIN